MYKIIIITRRLQRFVLAESRRANNGAGPWSRAVHNIRLFVFVCRMQMNRAWMPIVRKGIPLCKLSKRRPRTPVLGLPAASSRAAPFGGSQL